MGDLETPPVISESLGLQVWDSEIDLGVVQSLESETAEAEKMEFKIVRF